MTEPTATPAPAPTDNTAAICACVIAAGMIANGVHTETAIATAPAVAARIVKAVTP